MTKLNQSEDWFWKTEPRIIVNLLNEKKIIDKEEMKAQSAYIACCVWGKDPDEFEDDGEGIAGIDKPADANTLSQFGI